MCVCLRLRLCAWCVFVIRSVWARQRRGVCVCLHVWNCPLMSAPCGRGGGLLGRKWTKRSDSFVNTQITLKLSTTTQVNLMSLFLPCIFYVYNTLKLFYCVVVVCFCFCYSICSVSQKLCGMWNIRTGEWNIDIQSVTGRLKPHTIWKKKNQS